MSLPAAALMLPLAAPPASITLPADQVNAQTLVSPPATDQPEQSQAPTAVMLPPGVVTTALEATDANTAPAASGGDCGEIVVTARPRSDPLRGANAVSFAVTQVVDDAVIGPAAHTYEHVVPRPVRGGLRNFFYNLHEPTVFLNYLVQLKPGKAAETLARLAVNSTIGLAGIMDVARRRPFNLPRRPNSFGDSLGYYGVKPGPYLFLPLIGPTTLRDLFGSGIDRLAVPSLVGGQVGGTAYVATRGSLKLLDRRLGLDDDLQTIRAGPKDAYAARRALYLRKRQDEIDRLRSKHRRSSDVALPGARPSDASMQKGESPVVPAPGPDVRDGSARPPSNGGTDAAEPKIPGILAESG